MNPLSLIKKIPGGEDAIETVKDTVNKHPILTGVTLIALGAILVLAIFFGIVTLGIIIIGYLFNVFL